MSEFATPSEDLHFYSVDRPYNLDEATYDQHYNRVINPTALQNQIIGTTRLLEKALLARAGTDAGGSSFTQALEIGCGTGRFTLPLLASGKCKKAVITDGSASFVRLTRKKYERYVPEDLRKVTSLRWGVLNGEEIGKAGDADIDLIVLAAVLHHFVDWKLFLSRCAAILRPGGVVIMQEPCVEFSMIFAPLLTSFVRKCTETIDGSDKQRVQQFCNALMLRTRPDCEQRDKMEDKHIFRTDQIITHLSDLSFEVLTFPNGNLADYSPDSRARDESNFRVLLQARLRYMAGFSEEFCQRFLEFMSDEVEMLACTYANRAGPNFDATYICVKR
jgi:ubiquinone/menaquinone biosynthesis C-methylase UbiE